MERQDCYTPKRGLYVQDKLQKLDYYKWLILAVVCTGTFMSTMASSIVNVGLPPITIALHSDILTAQWVVTAYMLVITSLLPLMGRLGDVWGQRKIYSYGFIGFVLGSLLCGLANSMGMLIGFRVLQAIGASALIANSMGIVAGSFPQNERGKVLGIIGTVVALGGLCGPGLGGLLVEHFGWHTIFFVNIPAGLLGYAGVRLVLPLDKRLLDEKIDYLGASLFTGGMISFLLALSYGSKWGWFSLPILGCFSFAAFLFVRFIKHERRIDYPMLELSIFNNWAFSAGNIAGMLSFMAMFTSTMLVPYYLHDVLAFSPGKIGLIMSAFPLIMAVTSPISGMLSDKVSTNILATTGLVILAAGLIITANLQLDSNMWLIMTGQALMGFGNGLFQSPNNNSVMSSVQPRYLGIAGGVNALGRNFGMISGTALAVAILEYRRAVNTAEVGIPNPAQQLTFFLDGFHYALLVGAGLAIAGALVSFIRSGKRQIGGEGCQ